MNTDRRKRLDKIFSTLEEIGAHLESVRDDEQSAYDNLPESVQNGERGQTVQTGIEALESAVSSVEEARSYIEEAQGS